MTVTPLQPAGAPALAEGPAGKGKGGITLTDPGFASLLAMLLPGTLVPNPGLPGVAGPESTEGLPLPTSQSPLVPALTIANLADATTLATSAEQQVPSQQLDPNQQQASNQIQPLAPNQGLSVAEGPTVSPMAMAIAMEAMPGATPAAPSTGAEPLVTPSAGLPLATLQAPTVQRQATGGTHQEADGEAQAPPQPMALELPKGENPSAATKAQAFTLPDGAVQQRARRIEMPEPSSRTESTPLANPVSLQEGIKTPATAKAEVPTLDRLTGTVDVDRFADLVARSVRNSPDGQYTVSLRLHPESLGEVRLQIHLTGREVHTVMEVANPEARQALESRGDQLRHSLDQAGLTLTGFSVSTGHGRQSPRERRDAFADLLTGPRRIAPVSAPSNTDGPARIQRTDRRGGRLDTMA